jgi:hypothetical protein
MIYTTGITKVMVTEYAKATTVAERKATVAQLASTFKISEKQVQGKLVAEKVWVKAEKKAKSEKSVSTKESLITALSILMGVDTLTSLKNASIKDLTVMVKAMNKRNDQFDAK